MNCTLLGGLPLTSLSAVFNLRRELLPWAKSLCWINNHQIVLCCSLKTNKWMDFIILTIKVFSVRALLTANLDWSGLSSPFVSIVFSLFFSSGGSWVSISVSFPTPSLCSWSTMSTSGPASLWSPNVLVGVPSVLDTISSRWSRSNQELGTLMFHDCFCG